MPNKESRFEFVRVRTKREKDKDRDRDARSVAESSTGSTTTIRERKHRNSLLAGHGATAETASQASAATYQDVSLDQLPPLPETECSDSASTTTSPILRTTSNISNPPAKNTPVSFETPANLQPYLESEPDTSSTAPGPDTIAEPQEWIGPRVEVQPLLEDPSDSVTPTPRPKRDPLASAGKALSKGKPDIAQRQGSPPAMVDNQGRLIADTNAMVYSWAGSDSGQDQYYDASEMTNPFLPMDYSSPASQRRTPPTPESIEASPIVHRPRLHRSPPPPPQPGLPSRERGEPRPHSRIAYGPPARIEPPHVPYGPPARIEPPHVPHGPPVRIEPPHVPRGPPIVDMSIQPSYGWPMVPAPSPIPLQHNTSSPLPYPNIHPPLPPPPIDHPAHILHRIGSVLPDIGALMDMYQSTCSTLLARDMHIEDLRRSKAAEAEQNNRRIDKLNSEIEELTDRHATKVKQLMGDIASWEDKHGRLEQSHTKEKKMKEEARTAHTQLKVRFEDTKQKHQYFVDEMKTSFSLDKERLGTVHAEEIRQWQEQTRLAARDAERDMQAHEVWWQKRMREVEEQNARTCRDLENVIRNKEKELEEERQNYSHAKADWQAELDAYIQATENERQSHTIAKVAWDKERTATNRQKDEECTLLKQATEDAKIASKFEHRKETDESQKSMDAIMSRQAVEAQEKVTKLQRENQNLQEALDRTHSHYTTEIQNATANFSKEKEDYAKATQAASSRQQAEMQDTIRNLQIEKEKLLQSRVASPTRQINEVREHAPEKEKESLSRVSSAEKGKPYKSTLADGASRSSTPAPKEERNRIHRASGIYGSGTNLKSKSLSPEQQSKMGEPTRKSEDGRTRPPGTSIATGKELHS